MLPSSDSNHSSNIKVDTIKVAYQKEHKPSLPTWSLCEKSFLKKIAICKTHHLFPLRPFLTRSKF